MTPALRNKIADRLPGCRTLDEAETSLRALKEMADKKFMCWGIWDGYAGRAPSTHGLSLGKDVPKAIETDYREGLEIGREISLRGVPR